jgi:hypothetical protein
MNTAAAPRPRPVWRRRLTAALGAAVLAGPWSAPTAGAAAAPSVPTIAYAEFLGPVHIASGTWRTTVSNDASGGYAWAPDGKYFTFVDYPNGHGTLHVTDSRGGHLKSWPCECDTGGRFIGGRLLAVDRTGHLLTFNPAGGLLHRVVITGIPAQRPYQYGPATHVVAAVPSGLIIAVPGPGDTPQEALYLLSPAGHARHLANDLSFLGVGEGVTSPNGRYVAWNSEIAVGACSSRNAVKVLDVNTGVVHELTPPGPKWYLLSVNFTTTGQLSVGVVAAPTPCPSGHTVTRVVHLATASPTAAALTVTRTTYQSDQRKGPYLAYVSGTVAVSAVGTYELGRLVIRGPAGSSTAVANQVNWFQLRP